MYFLAKKNLILLFFFSILFLGYRYIFFKYYPSFTIQPDSFSYFYEYRKLSNGIEPNFLYRSPLYPIISFIIFSIHESLFSIILFQNILTFITSVFFYYLIFNINKFYQINFILLFFIFCIFNSSDVLEHDFSYLTESVYTNIIILSFCFLYFGVVQEKKPFLFCSSIFFSFSILIKAAAIFLIPIFLFIITFLIIKKKLKELILFFFPFVIVIFILMLYNFTSQNNFILTNSDARELTITNGFFWKTNSKYPEDINKAITKINDHYKNKIPKKDYEILKNSWNIKKLYPLYAYWDYKAESEIKSLFPKNKPNLAREWLIKINIDTIVDKPLLFFKHYIVMMTYSFYTITQDREPFENFLKYSIYKNLHIKNVERFDLNINQYKAIFFEYDNYNAKNYYNLKLINNQKEHKIYFLKDGINIKILKDFQFTIIKRLNILFNIFLHNFIWLILFFIATVFIIFKFYNDLKQRKISKYNFFFLIICMSKFASYSVVSLVEISQIRYIYPYKWQYYLLSIMLFIEFTNYIKLRSNKNL